MILEKDSYSSIWAWGWGRLYIVKVMLYPT